MVDSTMSKMQKGKQPKSGMQASGLSKAAGIPYSTAEKMLTKKQKTLPEALKKKIIESKKSGAGYSGTYK